MGWVHLLRPKQWIKNVLVFAAPGSARILFEPGVMWRVLVAFVLISAAASGTYLINDVVDVEADRRHPTKRQRPVASGRVAPRSAVVVGASLLIGSLALSLLLEPLFGAVVGAYVVTTVAYSLALKHIAVIELVALASGFVLRALAGAAVVDVAISNWFFVVTTFGSLFMISGKRLAEFNERSAGGESTRAVLDDYTEGFLRHVRTVASGAAILAYALWAFERAAESTSEIPWFQLSIVPITTGFFYYALLIERGHGGAPEELAFTDRTLPVIGASWLALFALGLMSLS